MVEIFVVYVESVEKGNEGFLSKKTCKKDGGINVEFLREIQETNPKSDITNVVAYFTRGSALKAKDLVLGEITNFHPNATVNAEVKGIQISLADSRRLNNSTWIYK